MIECILNSFLKKNIFIKYNNLLENYYISITSIKNKYKIKPKIVIINRLKPNHNCSSFIVEGLIKSLMNEDNIRIKFLLMNFEIIIIPFYTYFSSIFGNNYKSVDGIETDNWSDPKYNLNKQNQLLKLLLKNLKNNSKIIFYIEFHDDPNIYNYNINLFEDKNNYYNHKSLINIFDYYFNFFDKNNSIIDDKIKKFKILKKKYRIDYLMKFSTSIYGNEKKDLLFLMKDYKRIGRNFWYCWSLFLGKINNKLELQDELKIYNKEIDQYYYKIKKRNKKKSKIDINKLNKRRKLFTRHLTKYKSFTSKIFNNRSNFNTFKSINTIKTINNIDDTKKTNNLYSINKLDINFDINKNNKKQIKNKVISKNNTFIEDKKFLPKKLKFNYKKNKVKFLYKKYYKKNNNSFNNLLCQFKNINKNFQNNKSVSKDLKIIVKNNNNKYKKYKSILKI